MVLTIDQQVKVLALLVSLESLGAPLSLLLVCQRLRRGAAAVMPALKAKRALPWTSVTSVLQTFSKAKRLSFSSQREKAFLAELLRGRELHALNLTNCGGVTDVSALAGCASLHTLNLINCGGVTDVSALAGCASLHTLNLSRCGGHDGVTGTRSEW